MVYNVMQCCVLAYRIRSHYVVFCHIVLCCVILDQAMSYFKLCYVMLHHILFCYVVFYCIGLYYIVFEHNAILFYFLFCSTLLYYFELHSTITYDRCTQKLYDMLCTMCVSIFVV